MKLKVGDTVLLNHEVGFSKEKATPMAVVKLLEVFKEIETKWIADDGSPQTYRFPEVCVTKIGAE
jgi:hypothetical protein